MSRAWSAVLLAALLLPRDGSGQRAVRVRADNDAFNFWQAPWNRPDEEYTSGVRLTVELAGRARWAGRRADSSVGCAGASGAAGACTEHSYALGQDIYTAVRSRERPAPAAGARPDAGVLWLSASNRRVLRDRMTEVRWLVGVTGKPALAAPLQRLFHDIAPGWNGPIDWNHQLPTEPVFAVSYDEQRHRRAGTVQLQPHAGASLGNLLTEVRAGVAASGGASDLGAAFGVRAARLSVGYFMDASVHAVARSEVLSGTMFRPSERVALRPIVPELQAGVRARWKSLGVAFVAHQTGSEYTARRRPHAWSTLEAEWWPR